MVLEMRKIKTTDEETQTIPYPVDADKRGRHVFHTVLSSQLAELTLSNTNGQVKDAATKGWVPRLRGDGLSHGTHFSAVGGSPLTAGTMLRTVATIVRTLAYPLRSPALYPTEHAVRKLIALLLHPAPKTAQATDVQTLARIKGQASRCSAVSGLSSGFPGTGDSGKELAMSRPLSELLKNNGMPVATLGTRRFKGGGLGLRHLHDLVSGACWTTGSTSRCRSSTSAKSLKGGRST